MRFEKRRQEDWEHQIKHFLDLEASWSLSTAWANGAALLAAVYLGIRYFSANDFKSSLNVGFVLGCLIFLLTLNFATYWFRRQIRFAWKSSIPEQGFEKRTRTLDRKAFEDILEDEIRRAGRYRYPLTLCRLDLDDFKSFHESFGEARANERLENFCRLIRGTIRESDAMGHYDHDEFFILLPHTDLVRSEKFISRVLKATTEEADCTFSAGLTPYRAGENKSEFMQRAHHALNHAKQDGKKKVCCVIGKDNQEALVQF